MIYRSKLNDEYELLQSEGESCLEGISVKDKKIQGDITYAISDNCVYIGTESEKFQCGFVIKDKKVEDKIKKNIFGEDIKLDSEYTDEFIDMIINFMNSFCIVNRLGESILKAAFKEDENGNGFYDSENAAIDSDDMNRLKNIVENYLKKIKSIENEDLRGFFLKAIDEQNAEALLKLCSEEKILKLTKVDTEAEARKKTIKEAEEKVLDLYERLAAFQEEIIGIFEEITAA